MASNWVDFKAVKDTVTFEMVLEHYQLNGLRKEKQELVGRCPIHQGEGDRAFHVSLTKNAFNCFSTNAGSAAPGRRSFDPWGSDRPEGRHPATRELAGRRRRLPELVQWAATAWQPPTVGAPHRANGEVS